MSHWQRCREVCPNMRRCKNFCMPGKFECHKHEMQGQATSNDNFSLYLFVSLCGIAVASVGVALYVTLSCE